VFVYIKIKLSILKSVATSTLIENKIQMYMYYFSKKYSQNNVEFEITISSEI